MDTGIFIGDKVITTSWDKIWDKPNTLSGYGITDAYTKSDADGKYVLKAGDTVTGDLSVAGQLFAGNEQFVATLLYTFIGRDKGIYFSSDANNGSLYVNTHYDRSYQAESFIINEANGVVTFQNNPTVKSNTILHTGNYAGELDNRYVNKIGDAMTGNLVFAHTSERPSYSGSIGITFREQIANGQGVKLVYNNYDNYRAPAGLILVGEQGGEYFEAPAIYQNGYKVWDAGNDGSGSGLDADLLDGKHLGNVGDRVMRQIGFPDYNEFGSSDINVYLRKVLGWCYNNVNTGADDSLFIGVGHPNALGNMQIQVYCNSGINEEGYPGYSTGVYFPLGSNPIIFGTNQNNYWQKTLACISDNVASATRLATPRTIFSKPFDGTGNVTGGAKFSTICIETDNNGNDSERGGEINNYVGPVQLQQASPNGVHMCMGGGQVGICTTSPKYTLHVDGVIYAKDGFRETSDIRKKKVLNSHTVSLDDMAYADLFDYTLIDDEKEIVRVGTNAHYWLDKLPQVVTKDNDEYLSLNYGVLGTVCALSVSKYVKQLEDRVTLLENKIASLQ